MKEVIRDIILFFGSLVLMALCGCQTVIKGKKFPEQVVMIEGKTVIASGGWEASARSPLFATESLRGLDLGVGTNSTVYLKLDTYNRDLSTNTVVLTEKALDGAANLAAKIGAAIATSGASVGADAISTAAKSLYEKFTAAGGNVENAIVECKDGVCTVTDGSVSCSDGSCSDVE
jgi:hypothetical protein